MHAPPRSRPSSPRCFRSSGTLPARRSPCAVRYATWTAPGANLRRPKSRLRTAEARIRPGRQPPCWRARAGSMRARFSAARPAESTAVAITRPGRRAARSSSGSRRRAHHCRADAVIELVSADRCIKCDACVEACPDNVFDSSPGEVPTIARIEDCQTCFLCELYCPTDALYVSPFRQERELVDEATLIARGLLGG